MSIFKLLPILLFISINFSSLITISVYATDETIEELVVTGKRPGPKLWKVEHGDNVLWVMGLAEPLPKSLKWDDVAVGFVMEQSKVLLVPPGISVSVNNPLKAISAFGKYKKLQKLPKGTVLFDVLSKERQHSYQRILDKYGIKTNRNLRPLFTVKQLHEKALKRVGLVDAERIQKRLRKIAKSHKVEIIDPVTEMDVNQALEMLKNVKPNAELACFDAALEQLDQSVELAVEQAKAWADGDHAALAEVAFSSDYSSCSDALLSSAQGLAAKAEARSLWLSHARSALSENKVSFAYLSINEIVSADGLISKLKSSLSE